MSFYVCYPQKSRKPYTCSSLLCGQLAHAKSMENQQYYTNRKKQRRWNGGIFLLPNWLSKYPLQTMDASHYKHSLQICRSRLHTQHHTSWLLQQQKNHSPARKRDYGIRRCQILSQRHLCPYCGFYLSFQYHWPRLHALNNVRPRFPDWRHRCCQ